ncbi:response regulator [uncultured Planktomarina sp.]|jgi:response regulator RpfG family c-di-GMP phosphodiesterase|uniref:response regulator n=1 Tax=uncultured Planktomarina sp. TaxID=1538529 RepID=UPI00326155EA
MTGMSNTLHSLKPTSRRPLHGLMVLLVEDSLTAGEAVRLICITSGARLRRADCIESARRHLRIYRPDVAIVDMGLPDGDGAVLISELAQANPRTQTIIGLSADPNRAKAAMEAGADSFIEKPLNSIAGFQSAILMNLPHHRRPMDIRLLPDLAFEADQRALQEDVVHALELLNNHEKAGAQSDYLAAFIAGVARTASDPTLERAAEQYSNTQNRSDLRAALTDFLAEKIAV